VKRAIVSELELPVLHHLGAQTRSRRGVLEHAVGVGRGRPGGLGHHRVEEGARPRSLIAPGHAADDGAGETGEQHHEPHEGQGERRTVPEYSSE